MTLDLKSIGNYLRQQRARLPLTQAELAERLNVSAQSVSNWERGESLPDVALLPDLARILDCSIDAMLGGGQNMGCYRRRITVAQMREAIGCIERFRALLGQDHFMVRTIIDALEQRMSSAIEPAFAQDQYRDAYVAEALLACVDHGDYVDLNDVREHIASPRVRETTLSLLREKGLR